MFDVVVLLAHANVCINVYRSNVSCLNRQYTHRAFPSQTPNRSLLTHNLHECERAYLSKSMRNELRRNAERRNILILNDVSVRLCGWPNCASIQINKMLKMCCIHFSYIFMCIFNVRPFPTQTQKPKHTNTQTKTRCTPSAIDIEDAKRHR